MKGIINMIREIAAMDLRKNFGEILNEVKYRHDSVLIKKAGKPIAALIDIDLFERVKNLRAQFDSLTQTLEQAYNEVPSDVAEAEIQEALDGTERQI